MTNHFSGVQRTFLLLAFSLAALEAVSQIGGKHSFEFLNVSPSARQAALGGVNVSLADRDLNLFAANPALAGDTLAATGSVSYLFYMADVGQAFVSYALPMRKAAPVTVAVQHIRYGEIKGFDASGVETSDFYAGETALMVSRQHEVGNFRMGVTLKGVFSRIAGYNASGVMIDLGGIFVHPGKLMTAGLVIKNLGFLTDKYSSARNTVPFDVQAGTTFKPEHMPLRFSITAFNLTSGDVTYYNRHAGDEAPGTITKILSHLNMGAEILIHRHVTLMGGYNFLLHQALKLDEGGAGSGISFGLSANIRTFEFVFGRNSFVAGNAGYCFTLSSNINKIIKRRS